MPFDRGQRLGLVVLGVLVVAGLAVVAASPTGPLAGLLHPLEYDRATVTVADENGATLGTVDVRIADTDRERYVGLSETDALPESEGMLFVFDADGDRAFVMRNMSFPLDILFAGPEGRIRTIHHAPTPDATPESDLRRYRGRARFVLEVPRGYANRTGIEVGDRLLLPDDVTG